MCSAPAQIDQMVRFIKQEAQEKANEIGVSAEEVHLLLRPQPASEGCPCIAHDEAAPTYCIHKRCMALRCMNVPGRQRRH